MRSGTRGARALGAAPRRTNKKVTGARLPVRKIDEASAASAFTYAIGNYDQAFGTFFLAKLLGLEISFFDRTCRVELDVKDYMFNPQGSLHGGIISTVLDIAMGHLLNHHTGPGATLEMTVQFIRPVRSGRVRADATFVGRGRKVNFLEARLVDGQQNLVAVATSTWKLLSRDPRMEASQ
jgi:uncharacterized protein (TIGR00369 family)